MDHFFKVCCLLTPFALLAYCFFDMHKKKQNIKENMIGYDPIRGWPKGCDQQYKPNKR